MATDENLAANGGGGAAVSAAKAAGPQHHLPRWVNFMFDNVLLNLLLLCEGYLLGTAFCIGFVPSLEHPQTWTLYQIIGVVLFFAAGFACAGIGLRASVAAPYYFALGGCKNATFGVVNLVGMACFFACEIWTNFYERAQHLTITPSDQALLNLLNIGAQLAFSPTALIGALVLNLAVLFYGFSQMAAVKPALEDPDEVRRKQDLALIKAQGEAAIRAAKAGGWAAAGRAAADALRNKKPEAEAAIRAADMPAEGDVAAEAAPEGEGVPGEAEGEGQKRTRRLPSGEWWSASDAVEYAKVAWGIALDEKAQARIAVEIRSRGNGVKADKKDGRPGKPGSPYIAPRRQMIPWMRNQEFIARELASRPDPATGTNG